MHGDVVVDEPSGECSCKGKKKKKKHEEVKFSKKMKKNMTDAERSDDHGGRHALSRKDQRRHIDADEESWQRLHKAEDGEEDGTESRARQDANLPGYKVKQNMKKNMKKKMKKHMEDDVEDIKDDLGGDEFDDDDVNDVETPDDDDFDDEEDDLGGDEDDFDDEGDDSDDDEDEGEFGGDDEGGEDDDDDEGDDAPKFGFMKDKKKCKKMKKNMKQENAFWGDIEANYKVPKDDMGTDKEFFDSLARQYGNPHVRFNGGVESVNEDLLLSPEQQALINAMPKPGEVGYAPSQRLGGDFSSSDQPDLEDMGYGECTDYEQVVEESADYEVLCKYFNEDVAYELITKRRRQS